MRRGLASLIMGLSLLVASASWAGFVMSRTVLDPGRSERLADRLLDDTEVRAAIIDRVADSLETQVPAGIPVTRQSLELAAELALDDPRVEALVRDGIVRAHQNALNGIDEPIVLDASAVGQAARDALVAQVPPLGLVLPVAPPVEVEVPGAGLSWLGTVKSYVDRYTLIGALIAITGVTTALVLARNRAAALRRVAFWAFASAAFWLFAGYAIPALLGAIAPSSVAIASAAVDVFFGAMIGPAVGLAVFGAVLLVISFAWPAFQRRRPAAVLDHAARSRQPAGGRRGGVPVPAAGHPPSPYAPPPHNPQAQYPPTQYPPTQYPPAEYPPTQYPPADYPPAQYPPAQYPPARQVAGYGHAADPYGSPQAYTGPSDEGRTSLAPAPFDPGPDATMRYPQILSGGADGPAPQEPGPREPGLQGGSWVEGLGYVDPSSGTHDAAPTAPPTRPDAGIHEAPTISFSRGDRHPER